MAYFKKTSILLVYLFLSLNVNSFASERGVDFLLNGVDEISCPGLPGSICVFGENAFTVIQDEQKNGSASAVVAAAVFGKGRIIAFGHGGYLKQKDFTKSDDGQFVLNAAHWTSGTNVKGLPAPVIGIFRMDQAAAFLKSSGVKTQNVQLQNLSGIDALFADITKISAEEQKAIEDFIKRGGGLVSFGVGWGWLQLNPGKDLRTDYSANQLLAPMGLVFTDSTTRKTTPTGFAAAARPSLLINAAKALEAFEDQSMKNRKLTDSEIVQIGATLSQAIHNIPEEDKLFLPKLKQLMSLQDVEPVPSYENPIRDRDILQRIILTEQTHKLKNLPAEEVKPHPAAENFPGSVPDDAPRVRRTLKIDTNVSRWHSTGLYAAPGDLIEVSVPASAAGRGLAVRIGAHKDRLWHKPFWRRVPEITREFLLKGQVTSAANAFGGAVYIVVPKNCSMGAISITVNGAVNAPFFELGKTDPDQWRKTIKNYPAPWAELVTSKVVLTVDSDYVRGLDDPEALMKTWDQVMDGCSDLIAAPRSRQSPERYVADVQISAGSMHAGYPIMTHMSGNKAMTDHVTLITVGNWGLFHEMGHNHQSRYWTFDGTGEVTCNLFSLYLQEIICGIKIADDRRVGTEGRKKQIQSFLDTGEKKAFPFLVMYVQLQEAFGWDAYKEVFAEYRNTPERQLPKTDDQRRDQWLVRLSKTVGKNLGSFFQAWKVQTSQKARASIAHLPNWMPEDFPPKN